MAIAQPLTVGEQASEFDLDTPDGHKITLKELTAKRTLIILQRHLG
jgi:peroxiredoxin